MSRPPKSDSDAVDRANLIISNPSSIEEFQIAQAFLLPLMGLSLEQTAQVLGRDRYWVSRSRTRFLRNLPPPKTHGGRRNAYFNELQEYVLVRDAVAEETVSRATSCCDFSLRVVLREKLEQSTKRLIDESTISDMLDRYANRMIPGAKWTEIGYVLRGVRDIAKHGRDLPQIRELSRKRALEYQQLMVTKK